MWSLAFVGNSSSVLVGREPKGTVYCSSDPRTMRKPPSEPSVFTVTTHTTSAPKPSLASATWPLFLGVLFMMIGNGLQISLIGVRSTLEAFPTTVTGIIIAAYYVGFLVGFAGRDCRAIVRLLLAVGCPTRRAGATRRYSGLLDRQTGFAPGGRAPGQCHDILVSGLAQQARGTAGARAARAQQHDRQGLVRRQIL